MEKKRSIIAAIFRGIWRLIRWIVVSLFRLVFGRRSEGEDRTEAPAEQQKTRRKERPAKREELTENKDDRWDKLERESQVIPREQVERGKTTSTTRLPQARGQMPPLTPGKLRATDSQAKSRRSSGVVRPGSEAGRREAVRMMKTPPPNVDADEGSGVGAGSGVRSASGIRSGSGIRAGSGVRKSKQKTAAGSASGVRYAKDPGNFVRGQSLYVAVPGNNDVFEARIANVGSKELMLSLTMEDTLQVRLGKGKPLIIYIPTQDGREYSYNAVVANCSGSHASWFSVRFDSMQLREKRRTERYEVDLPIGFRVGGVQSGGGSNVSPAMEGLLHDVGRGGFCLLTDSEVKEGDCIFQMPGRGAEKVAYLDLVGAVLRVRDNDDPETKEEWPTVVHTRLLRASRKLDEYLREMTGE